MMWFLRFYFPMRLKREIQAGRPPPEDGRLVVEGPRKVDRSPAGSDGSEPGAELPSAPAGLDRSDSAVRRYRLNLSLLVALLILLTVWFHQHLHLYFAEGLLIGGSLSLWGAWKIIQSNLQVWLGRETSAWTEEFLGRPGATECLVYALVLMGALWIGTSSIYLKYEGAGPGQSEFEVDALVDGNPYVPKLTVTSFRRIAGRPFLFRWGSPKVEFVITSPGGYRPEERSFWPWSAILLRVPEDFEKKKFHLLRLIPGSARESKVIGSLPPLTALESDWYMGLEINGRELRKVRNLRFQTLYIGAGSDDLERLVEGQDRQAFERELQAYLVEKGVPDHAKAQYLTPWLQERMEPTEELQPGDKVLLKIGREGGEPLTKVEISLSDDPIQNVRF